MSKKGGAELQDPWASRENQQMAAIARQPLMNAGNINFERLGRQFGQPSSIQNMALESLGNVNPQSFYQGNQGSFNDVMDFTSGGADIVNQARNVAGLGGSENLLGQTIGGQFLDVANNPIYQARNQAVTSQAQRFLNQNIDQLNAAGQGATGGVGTGSAQRESRRRAVAQTATGLGETLASLGAQDLAQERARQQEAMGVGLTLPTQRTQALGSLAQNLGYLGAITGQAGTAAGELGLKQAGMYGDLGSQLMQQQFQGQMLPYNMLMQYLNAAKGVPVQQPSLGGMLGGLVPGLSINV